MTNKQKALFCCVLLFVAATSRAQGQEKCNPKVSFEVQISEVLANANIIGLTNLGLDSEGRGPVLAAGFIQNLESSLLDRLFLEFKISAGKLGTLASYAQNSNNPFSLDPMQSLYLTNNNISDDDIPGIEENVNFNGGLTTEGEDFVENLGGTTLPSDVYTVEASLYRRSNTCGEVLLASTSAEIGARFTSEEVDIFLQAPGDVINGNIEITNPYPQFSWEGGTRNKYRLLVVNNNGQDSPESLIEGAKSSLPLSEGGSYLQMENLDVRVKGTSFQYPSSGAQPLVAGQTYYWQIIASIQTGGGFEERSSEIWSFKLQDVEAVNSAVEVNDETKKVLVGLIGEEQYNQFIEAGYTLEELELDGTIITGPEVMVILAEIIRGIEDGSIILGDNK